MKTKSEIEKRLKEEEETLQKIGDNPIYRELWFELTGKIRAFKWVLEEPEYKRTICDLTNQELFELLNIVFEMNFHEHIEFNTRTIEKICPNPNNNFSNVNFYFYVINTDNDTKRLLEVNIYNSLDITIQENGLNYSLDNISKYINTIRGMLSMEKPK